MRLSRLLLHVALVPTTSAAVAGTLFAQQSSADVPEMGRDECAYSACALNIAPRWNGLAVVRGSDGPPLANLHFFWPRDITASLRGPSTLAPGADSAAAQARRCGGGGSPGAPARPPSRHPA